MLDHGCLAPSPTDLLQPAINLTTPNYFHTHLLRDEHSLRLAKRHDALAIRTLRQQGLTLSYAPLQTTA
jgi:glutamyl/glutaminyl-tRNA synthetase